MTDRYEMIKCIERERLLEKAPKEITFASKEAARSFCVFTKANEGDLFGAMALDFINLWSRLMEAKMAEVDRNLTEDEVDECKELATPSSGDLGSIFYAARGKLIVHWKYGEMLMTEKEKELYPDLTEYYLEED